MMKRLVIYCVMVVLAVASAYAERFRWLYDLTFEAPVNSRVVYNVRDRLEMIIEDMTFVIQVYSNEGVDDDVLKRNLRRRAAEYNMYDTEIKKFSQGKLKGFYLKGTLPDGSIANIYNVISKKTGLCMQFIVNYTSDNEKKAKELVKSLKEEPLKEAKKKEPTRKQKIQKKDAPLKPIKKSTISPAELYEI